MLKQLLFTLAGIACIHTSQAQLGYTFSVSTDTYKPLTSGTSLNNGNMWDEENYKPSLGFTAQLGSNTITALALFSNSLAATDTQGVRSGFFINDADLHDRGLAGGSSSQSPIRYMLTGSAGSRIFKLEVYNAGFYDEYDLYGTNNDSVCYQVWLYEGSNTVELRYGPSKISHDTDYFYMGGAGKPIIGFAKNADFNAFTVEKLYFLTGNPASPTMDSTSSFTSISSGLNSYPASGTVYRFVPPSTGIGDAAKLLTGVNLTNTVCTNSLFVNSTETTETTYKVIAINGATVNLKGTLIKGWNSIELGDLAQGMYLIQFSNANGSKQQKFIKQ